MAYEDHFGFLPGVEPIEFDGGAVHPIESLTQAKEWMDRCANPDGHVYPPCGRADSQASVFLWRLPPSHSLRLDSIASSVDEPRHHAAGFVVHFLGLLYGRRCQFHDWWIDGRTALRGAIDYVVVRRGHASECLTRALGTWLTFNAQCQSIVTNALFLHSRTIVYQHEWERFQAEYQILDALYSAAHQSGQIVARRRHGHPDRLKVICSRFGLADDPVRMKYFVDLRNALIRDALWDGRMPGDAGSQESFYASLSLHKLTRHAAFAVLGLRGDYVRSPWWHLGSQFFDLR